MRPKLANEEENPHTDHQMPEPQNTTEETEFFDAIKAGDTGQVAEILQSTPTLLHSVDYKEFGAPPLNLAVWRDDQAMLDTLLKMGADLNHASDWEAGAWPPLQLALNLCKDELAEHMAELGAKIGVHEAAGLGRLEELQALLDESPDAVHERGGDGCFPLHFARTPQIAELLLERGADLEARDIDHNSTALHYLCASRPETAIYLMDRGAKPNVFSIIAAGDTRRLQQIIESDPQQLHLRLDEELFPPHPESGALNIMNFTLGCHSTPLHSAARCGRTEVIQLLLEAGLDINKRGDYDDCTPLHVAAWVDEVTAAEFLLVHGAEMDAESGEIHANTPAGWAIVAGSVHVLKTLLDRGAEMRAYYLNDAEAAASGAFRQYRASPQENYTRALEMLRERSG